MDLIRYHPSTENVVDLSVFELMMLMVTPFHHVTIISLFNLQINTMNYCIELCSHSPFLLHMYQIHGKILYVSSSLYLLLAFPSLAFVSNVVSLLVFYYLFLCFYMVLYTRKFEYMQTFSFSFMFFTWPSTISLVSPDPVYSVQHQRVVVYDFTR